MTTQPAADRNLLLGILALQLDMVTRDGLIAGMQAWILAKSRLLEDILVEQQMLLPEDRDLLQPLLQRHMASHQNSARRSLDSLSTVTPAINFLQEIPDEDLQQSLKSVRRSGKASQESLGPETISFDASRSWSRGRFRVLRPFAHGGLGEVSVAHDDELDRQVALKEIREQYADDEDSRARFLIEGEITGKLEHPGIVPVYGLGVADDGRPYYAMRFVDGQTFQQAIVTFHGDATRREESLEHQVAFRKLLGRFIDVCQAVGFAHSRGVIHRDLKPGNILLGEHGETLVVDWGLARVDSEAKTGKEHSTAIQLKVGSGSVQTLPGSAVGTPGYMSPEQAQGQLARIGPATDVYSLGCILYTILTGDVPVREQNFGVLTQRIASGDVPDPRTRNSRVPKSLEAICLKAMAVEPQNRYGTAADLAEDVERFLAGEAVTAYAEPWHVKARRWTRNHRTLVTSSLATIVVVALALGLGLAKVSSLNSQLETRNQQLREVNEDLNLANEQEKFQRELANIRLEQANRVAAQIVYTIDRRLESVSGAGAARNELLKQAEQLLDSLLPAPTEILAVNRIKVSQLLARADVAIQYQSLNRAREDVEQALALTRRLQIEHPQEPELSRDIAVCQIRLADCFSLELQHQAAIDRYRQAIELLENYRETAADQNRNRRHLAVVHTKLGQAYSSTNQFSQAERAYRHAERILVELQQAGEDVTRDMYILQQGQGVLARNLQDLKRAQRKFRSAFLLAKRMRESSLQNSQAIRDFVVCVTYLAELKLQNADFHTAIAYYRQALSEFEQLRNLDGQSLQSTRDLALCHDSLGKACLRNGAYGVAEYHHRQALKYREMILEQDPQSFRAVRDVAESYAALAELRTGVQNWPVVHELLATARQQIEQYLQVRSPAAEARLLLAEYYRKQAAAFVLQGDYDAAISIQVMLIAYTRNLPTNPEVEILHVRDEFNLAQLYQQLGQQLKAIEICARMEQRLKSKPVEQRSEEWQQILIQVHDLAAQLQAANSQWVAALKQNLGQLKVSQAQFEAEPDNLNRARAYSVALNRTADNLHALGHYELARPMLTASIALAESNAVASPANNQYRRDLCIAWLHWGDNTALLGDLQSSLSAYERARQIQHSLVEQLGSNPQPRYDYYQVLLKCAENSFAVTSFKQAASYYQHAIQMLKSVGPPPGATNLYDQELLRLQSLVETCRELASAAIAEKPSR